MKYLCLLFIIMTFLVDPTRFLRHGNSSHASERPNMERFLHRFSPPDRTNCKERGIIQAVYLGQKLGKLHREDLCIRNLRARSQIVSRRLGRAQHALSAFDVVSQPRNAAIGHSKKWHPNTWYRLMNIMKHVMDVVSIPLLLLSIDFLKKSAFLYANTKGH